ncbi:MAG: TetR/AcrR family transcriptional regulator [Bacilli bacterium]|nr:TetR/AcrR family transcriptional regulator [Bacilli bacterium]
MEQVDARIGKSKAELKKAFLKLLKENAFDHISVLQICKEANITRGTFYKYYEDKYELLYAIILDIRKLVSNKYHEMIDSNRAENDPDGCLKELIEMMIDLCLENKDILINLYADQDNSMIEYILKSAVDKFVKHVLDLYALKANLKYPSSLVSAIIVGGTSNLVNEWLTNEQDYPKQMLIDLIMDIFSIACSKEAIFVDKEPLS